MLSLTMPLCHAMPCQQPKPTNNGLILIPNGTILVHLGGISNEFGRAMVCILARCRQAEIAMARPNAMQCKAVQCNQLIQYNTILNNTIRYKTKQCNTTPHNTIQCNAMQCNAIQCNGIQYKLGVSSKENDTS